MLPPAEVYTSLSEATPTARGSLLLGLIVSHPEQRLVLPEREGGVTMLDGIDFSPGSLARAQGIPAGWPAGGGASLQGASLRKASLVGVCLQGANLRGADLQGANLRGANLEGAMLEESNLQGADLASANLRGCSLGKANLAEALLEETDLEGASLRFANLTNAVLESARLGRADLWGAGFDGASLVGTDLHDCVLREANLSSADLTHANLRNADLQGANLNKSALRGADLRGANLRGATLRGAVVRDAQLQGVALVDCDLSHAHFSGAWLEKTHLTREQLGGCIGEELAGEFEAAGKGYLALERNFVDLGNTDASSWAYLKKRRMQKRAALQHARAALTAGNWGRAFSLGSGYAADLLAEYVCDYGESVPRVLGSLLVVYLLFMLIYSLTGSVVRVEETPTGTQRTITRDPTDLAVFSLTAMTTSGTPSVGLQPRTDVVHLLTGLQALLGIALTGLLGFVLGNRIRR